MSSERSLGAARALARGLERGPGALPVPGLSLALSRVWGSIAEARPGRAPAFPPGIKIVSVGGATLGGSWRTPTSIALCASLSARGERVGLVSHGYGGDGEARRVGTGDDPHRVGDEAALAARALSRWGVEVASGRDRALAASLLVPGARRVVVDGLLRARGERGASSLLCLDGERPFGAGVCPPAGDLRAPPGALLGRADHVLVAVDPLAPPPRPLAHPSVHLAPFAMVLPVEAGDGRNAALVTAMGRPERLVRALGRRGVVPFAHLALEDHAGPRSWARVERAVAELGRCEVVLATEKCALRLPERLAGRPVRIVRLELALPSSLLDAVAG